MDNTLAPLLRLPGMVLDDYASDMTGRGLAPQTIAARMTLATRLYREWGRLDVPPTRIAAWLAAYQGWSRYTYHGHLTDLYGWAVRAGIVETSPMAGMKRPRTPKPKPRPLSGLEIARVLAAADDRVRAWLMLAYLAGLRAHEIAKFHGRDITEDSLYVYGKGGQGATLPTHPDLWELARQYPRDGYWFPSPYRHRPHISMQVVSTTTGRHFRACGIPDGSIHRVRATYGTALLRSGANIRVVQTLLRHSSLQTTEHYLGVNEDERARAVLGLRVA